MKKRLLSLIILSATITGAFIPCFTTAEADGVILAFPGAEGAGKYATGGRGGTVVHVTNLNDSGAGSLRDAVSRGNRIVVFDVGGTINLKSAISCAGNVTVAGQTAPGGKGITLKGDKFALAGDNIIVRFISSRPGEKGSGDYDAWGGSKGSNSVIDHCSLGWANDEQWGLYSNNMNYTVQYTIIGPSNCVSYHSKGAHGFGVMFGKGQASWHHNLLCHSLSRNYRGKVNGTETMDFVNNVIYDWGYQTAYGTFGHQNYVGNYLKMGPSTKGGQRFMSMNSGSNYDKARFYLTGNKITRPDGAPYSDAINNDNWNGGIDYGSHSSEMTNCRVDAYMSVSASNGEDASVAKNAESADAAYEHVTSYAGASVNPADNKQSGYNYLSDDTRCKIDAQVLYETITGTGSLTGGRVFSTVTDSDVLSAIEKYGIQYSDYNSYYPPAITEKTIVDSDNDGMPDEWELLRGLDPNDASDAKGDYLGQGYNNIEYYINDLTVNAFPEGVVTPSAELHDLGDDYKNAKEDADSLKLSNTNIKEKTDLTLPTQGAKGSSITWSSGSSAIVIKNNQISAVRRPSSANASVTLTASVTNGEYTIKRSFVVTVISLPTKFDFGGKEVQDGYAAVKASTKYSSNSSYGFTDGTPEEMERAPSDIPSGYDNLYKDQILGNAHFKAEMPNGKYTVVIHYGTWNTGFGTNFTVEGVNSGDLDSTSAAQYVAEIEITDGTLDVDINKGGKQYGGYINGLEILSPPDPVYHFDFGGGDVQSGYASVTPTTVYSTMTGYGFAPGTTQYAITRAPGNIPAGYENLYNDQIECESVFRANIPNGKYIVTIYYGSWNTGYGTNYTVEGVNSGNLYSTDPAQYKTKVEIKDGVLDLEIKKGDKSYGGYINGMDIMPLPGLPYYFDFGDGAVQEGFTQVTSSTVYSDEMDFGFAPDKSQNSMTRAPYNIPAGYENLHNDQIDGETVFKVNVPNGKYEVIIHYGSWNTGYGTSYTIEGVSSGNLASTDAAQYKTEAEVTDGVLDVAINKGSKSYGGYINGMEVKQIESYSEPTPTPTSTPTDEPAGKITVTIPQKPVSTESSLTMSVDISNETAKAVTADIIAAVYDENGVLTGVLIKRGESISKGESSQTFTFNGKLSVKTVKAMLFDSLKNMKPLCEAANETV